MNDPISLSHTMQQDLVPWHEEGLFSVLAMDDQSGAKKSLFRLCLNAANRWNLTDNPLYTFPKW
jgi:hypothetical protein